MKNYKKPTFLANNNVFYEVVNACSGNEGCFRQPCFFEFGKFCSSSCQYAAVHDDYAFGRKVGSHIICKRPFGPNC